MGDTLDNGEGAKGKSAVVFAPSSGSSSGVASPPMTKI
jgi:hypothetical protein